MKNLLACYANCRYNSRCEDIRNEIEDKLEQATIDINQYLAEKNSPPIQIQLLTKRLKFAPLEKVRKLKPKPEKKISNKPHTAKSQAVTRKKTRKRVSMARKAKTTQANNPSVDPSSIMLEESKEARSGNSRPAKNSSRPRAGSASRKKSGKGKLYIILENDSATLVDEQGLIKRMLTGHSSKARFFEAKEVEAQLQVVYKK